MYLIYGFSALDGSITTDITKSIVSCDHHNICKTDKTSLPLKFGLDFFRAEVIASKRGWLLMSDRIRPNSLHCYNPFVSSFINLPYLNAGPHRQSHAHPSGAFSTPPNASDSVIFVAQCSKFNVFISLYFWGQTSWEHYSFKISDDYYWQCEDVVYSQGKLYCVFYSGIMGVFGLESHSWIMVSSIPWFSKFHVKRNVAEVGGEIFVICEGGEFWHFVVFRFDGKGLNLIEVDGLENRAIFLNRGLSSVSIVADSKYQNQLIYTNYGFSAACIWSFSLNSKCKTQLTCGLNASRLLWIDPFT